LFANGRWFSSSTPSSSTIKTGRHDLAEILLKVALNTINPINQSNIYILYHWFNNLSHQDDTYCPLQKKIHNLEKSKINLSSYKENVVQKHYKSGRVDLQDNFGAKSNDFNYSIS
jgi:hypothetical protein